MWAFSTLSGTRRRPPSLCVTTPCMPSDFVPNNDNSPAPHDQSEDAADRACLELRSQVARAQRIVDRARQILSGESEVQQDESRTG